MVQSFLFLLYCSPYIILIEALKNRILLLLIYLPCLFAGSLLRFLVTWPIVIDKTLNVNNVRHSHRFVVVLTQRAHVGIWDILGP